jgi:LexA-binding, inner membrane-associated putative hydrolase
MFPLFHVFVPLLLFEIPAVKDKVPIQKLSLIIGSMLPDLIDKPLSLIWATSGRGIAHAPFFQILLFVPLFCIFKDKIIPKSLLIGTVIHLILDLPYIPLLWPFFQYEYGYGDDHIGDWIYTITHNPLVISTEIIGIIGLLLIAFKHQLILDVEKIKNYLFRIEKKEIQKSKTNINSKNEY